MRASAFERVDVEAADDQLVAVAQCRPLDRLAVEQQSVEAAVVQHPEGPARLGDDQGVAAGDAGVVELQVSVGAAADPGPAAFDLEAADRLVFCAEGEEAAGAVERRPRLVQPVRRRGGVGEGEFAGAGGEVAVVLAGGEDRVAAEADAAALGARWERLRGPGGELSAAVEAEKRAGAGGSAGTVGALGRIGSDAVEDRWPSFPNVRFDPSTAMSLVTTALCL